MHKVILKRLIRNSNFFESGSRFFAKKYKSVYITDYTDYDFYCLNSEENRYFLENLNMKFTDWAELDYCDDLAVGVYKSPCGMIEVVLRSDIGVYAKAVSFISEEYYTKYLHKSSPHFEGTLELICDHFNGIFALARIAMNSDDFSYDDDIFDCNEIPF